MTQPSDPMMGFIISLLTPFLMTAGITDIGLARRAVTETIAAYQAAGPSRNDQLVSIAQTVAFALASLDNLRLSMPADLSLSMKLKLRGNANALNRSSRDATATLDSQRRDTPAAEPEPDPTKLLAALEDTKTLVRQAETTPPAGPITAGPITDREIDLSWASAMTDIATEFSAELPNLQPAQRRTYLARIGALSEIARTLSGPSAPPLKARLLGSTSLRG
jgi:hypothetical protein